MMIPSRAIKRTTGVLCVLVLAGCNTRPVTLESHEFERDEKSLNALETLREVSVEARNELRLLAQAKEASARENMTREQQKQQHFQALHVPAGFKEGKTFYFQGRAIDAAEALAKLADYEFQKVGKPIPTEPQVYIDTRGAPLMEALRELGTQTGSQVRVEIYEDERLMRYVYRQQ